MPESPVLIIRRSIFEGVLETGQHAKDPRPLEYQEEGTLCEAGAATHRENQQHGEGNVEVI